MPKQAACAAIIHSDSCGYDFWTEDGQIRIFVTYDANGLIDSYRLEYGADVKPYDGETEISFEDLYERAEEDYRETYRAEIPGTVEYQHKQEAAEVAAQAAATAGQKETWMDEAQQEQFRQICRMIDTIKSGRDFYRVMNRINYGGYSVDVINAAREFKNSDRTRMGNGRGGAGICHFCSFRTARDQRSAHISGAEHAGRVGTYAGHFGGKTARAGRNRV